MYIILHFYVIARVQDVLSLEYIIHTENPWNPSIANALLMQKVLTKHRYISALSESSGPLNLPYKYFSPFSQVAKHWKYTSETIWC